MWKEAKEFDAMQSTHTAACECVRTFKKITLATLGRSYTEQKNPFTIGHNSARCFYYTDLSRFVPSVSIEYLTICWICPDSRISWNELNSKKLRKRANLTGKGYCSSKEPWEPQKEFWDENCHKFKKCDTATF